MELLTVGQAAERLSEVEPYEDTPPEYHARQLRAFIERGIVQPVSRRGSGRNARALLDADRLCIARLASTLTRMGVQPPHLEQAMRCLHGTQPHWFGKEPPPEARGHSYALGGLPTLVTDGIRRGETWYFRLWIEPVPKGTAGLGQVLGGFRQNNTGIEEYLVQGYPCIVINVSRLFGPLLGGTETGVHKPEPAAAAG